jgi:uncharacterized protein
VSADLFAPFTDIATQLLSFAIPNASDGAHDIAHTTRVWKNAQSIAAHEGGNLEIIVAATLLHDCVSVEKDSPDRAKASILAATAARDHLANMNWDEEKIAHTCHAIEAHSFSAGIAPETLEAKILQDADRLDAIGLIGIARCFYVAGRMGSALYEPNDPRAAHRLLDDRSYAIDHFETKLLTLADGFKTEKGQRLAKARHEELLSFRSAFFTQISA